MNPLGTRVNCVGAGIVLIAGILIGASSSALTSSYVRMQSTMHTGAIARIATDGKGRYVVSCSVDKTAKLWDAGSGELLKTFYPPSGPGMEGCLYACALSPDARICAVGGWTGWSDAGECSVYLFDIASGEMSGRISGLPYPVADLVYSKNGVYLATSLYGSFGVRIYRTSTLTLLKTLGGFSAACTRCVFDSHGQLAVACENGAVRVFSPDFSRFKELPQIRDLIPYSLAFSQSDGRLAVGYENSAAVTVYSHGAFAKPFFIPENFGLGIRHRQASLVAWDKSSNDLYVLISNVNPDDTIDAVLRRYTGRNLTFANQRFFRSSLLLDAKPMPDNTLVFCGSSPQLGKIGISQGLVFSRSSDMADFRTARVGLSRTAQEVCCNIGNEGSFVFSLADRAIRRYSQDSLSASIGLRSTDTQTSTFAVAFNHRVARGLKRGEYRICSEANKGSNAVVVGTNWNLCRFDTSGTLLWQKSTPGPVYAVALAQDAGMCAAALGDKTIRWYRLSSGAEVLALVISTDKKRWAVWTPNGYWDASVHGNDLLCEYANHGNTRAADCTHLDRLVRDGYNPDAIAGIFDFVDSFTVCRPSAYILQPVNGEVLFDSIVTVKVKMSSPRNAPITRVAVAVNNREQWAALRGLTVVSRNETTTKDYPVNLQSGKNIISAAVFNKWGCGSTESVTVVRSLRPQRAPLFPAAPRLFVLSVGISRYASDIARLSFADKDAEDFARFWYNQNPLPYRQIVPRLLTNESASRNAILGQIKFLASKATRRDVVIVFVAAHSRRDTTGRFCIVTSDAPANIEANAPIAWNVVSDKELLEPLTRTGARVLCFLDACDLEASSAGFAKTVRNNIVILQASSPFEAARESSFWGNGVFTKALLEGLNGKADFTHSGVVTVSMLVLYISQRVRELTAGLQTPVATLPVAFADFPVALSNR